jgi:hypothetical protein
MRAYFAEENRSKQDEIAPAPASRTQRAPRAAREAAALVRRQTDVPRDEWHCRLMQTILGLFMLFLFATAMIAFGCDRGGEYMQRVAETPADFRFDFIC